jgi:glyoxylase-like metal-dependent hydrolase (beta-lactamase superfamily II)
MRTVSAAAWAETLDSLVDLASVIVPGHGPVGGAEEVRALQGYLRACVDADGEPGRIRPGPWDDWTGREWDPVNVERASMLAAGDTGVPIACYHGGLARGARDRLVAEFQEGQGAGALVLSLKAGGTGLNLTAASHVVLYDRWWNPAVEDQARDRAWRIGQTRTVVSHRLVCPGTVDERVEEVVAGKRHIADIVLPKSSSLADLDATQLRAALGLRPDELLTEEDQ